MHEMQEMRAGFLGQEDPLEKEMPTHCNILAWRTAWTEEPGGLWSIGSQGVTFEKTLMLGKIVAGREGGNRR